MVQVHLSPPMKNVKNFRCADHLGGLDEKYLYERDGKTYMFKTARLKPAISGSNEPAPYKAFASVAASKVHKIIEPNAAIDVFAETLPVDGKDVFGCSVEIIPTKNFPNYIRDGKINPEYAKLIPQLLREFVVDYITSNKDGDLILGKDGIVRGVDKTQCFRYASGPKSRKLERSYELALPTEDYHSVDFSVIDTYIKRIEAVPTEQYMEIWKEYIESVKGFKPFMAEHIKNTKLDLRANLYDFIANVLSANPGFSRGAKKTKIDVQPQQKPVIKTRRRDTLGNHS